MSKGDAQQRKIEKDKRNTRKIDLNRNTVTFGLFLRRNKIRSQTLKKYGRVE